MKNIPFVVFVIFQLNAFAQGQTNAQAHMPFKFIHKVEVFAGGGLCMNYGNMFVENYRANYSGNIVTNKRHAKTAYNFGFGASHSISRRIELNARIQYEIKGIKSELNTPLNPINNDARIINFNNYTYRYLNLILAPKFFIGASMRFYFSMGGYYGKIKEIKSQGWTYNTLDQQKNEGDYIGRYFEHLQNDGAIDSFTWMPGLRSFEPFDYGTSITIGYSMQIAKKHSMAIQLVDNLGLRNINKDNPYGLKEKNHSIYITITYEIKRPIQNK